MLWKELSEKAPKVNLPVISITNLRNITAPREELPDSETLIATLTKRSTIASQKMRIRNFNVFRSTSKKNRPITTVKKKQKCRLNSILWRTVDPVDPPPPPSH
jgi:hypothetical protein